MCFLFFSLVGGGGTLTAPVLRNSGGHTSERYHVLCRGVKNIKNNIIICLPIFRTAPKNTSQFLNMLSSITSPCRSCYF